ncbi:MAG: CoA transferase [Actinomycetota bacterium]
MIRDLQVLEIAGSVAGGYAAKLLADRGATVSILSLDGRSVATDQPSAPDPAMRLYLDVDKSRINDATEAQLAQHVAAADIVIQSSAPDPLLSVLDRLPADERRINVQLSPFGRSGPDRAYRSTDVTDQARSGHLFLNGDLDREPLQGPEHQVAYAVGVHGAIGALAAVLARNVTGRGQLVEVTHHEVMTALHQFTLLRYTHNGDILRRMGNRYAGPGRPAGLYQCGDGLISLIAPRGDQLETLVSIAGLDHLLERPDIDHVYDLMHHPTLLDEHLGHWLASQELEPTIELLQAVRVPAASVSTMADLLADEHLSARDYWRAADQGGRSVLLPRSPIRETVVDVPEREAADGTAPVPVHPRPERTTDLANGPLSGVRVLDLTRVWAGPCATRIMADLGADVIMVEAPWARGEATVDETSVAATRYYPDNDPGEQPWNRNGFCNKFNLNKRNIALDLSQPGAVAVLEDLITGADVLIENYSPRVMPQFGLDEHRLHALNPSLIYVTMPGFGRRGPLRDRVAYGPVVDSQGGLSVLMGYAGETARKAGVAWPDPVAGVHAACATIGALVDRAEDGRGRTLELAQLEATVAMTGHAVADRQLSGVEPKPIGNRHRRFVPQGVYRCTGTDRWLALSVVDDRSWAALCAAAPFDPAWRDWTEPDRRTAEDMIDTAIEAWTSTRDPDEVAMQLQSVGVPAAAVADAPAVMADRHHRARGFFVELHHPLAGTHPWPTLPIRLSDTPATYRRPGANLNQHGREILGELGEAAGYSPEAVAALFDAGIITDRPPG